MTNEEVMTALQVALKEERRALSLVLQFLAEVEKRKLMLEEGYSSLFRFCTEALGLSRNCSLRRICASRMATRFPQLLPLLEAGKLHLTSILALSKHLTSENVDTLIALAVGSTEKALERKLAGLFPSESKKNFSKVNWLTEEEALLTISVPASLLEKLERVRELRKRAHPQGEAAVLLEESLDNYLERIDPLKKKPSTRKSSRKESRRQSRVHPRRTRQRVSNEVWQRDEGQCVFVAESGKRCGERAYIEEDHHIAWAHGGSSLDVGNIRLLCSAHNRWLGEKTFGPRRRHR